MLQRGYDPATYEEKRVYHYATKCYLIFYGKYNIYTNILMPIAI